MYNSAAMSSRVGRVRSVVVSVIEDDEDDGGDGWGRGGKCAGRGTALVRAPQPSPPC